MCFAVYHNYYTGAVDHSTALVLGVSLTLSSVAMFFLGALTSALVIFFYYIPRRLKAPPSQTSTSTSTSGTTRAPPPQVPEYEELNECTTSLRKIELKGNVAYPSIL